MPCFHGLAVSIHTTGPGGGPLAEFGIQKQTKFHRITSYVPVPTPKLQPGTTKPEPATFAISITLLTPGLPVPYSQPSATEDDPQPRPKIVGSHTESSGFRNKHGVIAPYTPVSSSANETIAAYIYFDGRPKEEVATLLRRGEETWVNSRWVSIPESEGGGLAEKEFIFREVGLERWLNGLDLEGKDAKAAAATVEKRRQRFERKRRIKKELLDSDDDDMDEITKNRAREKDNNGILRYGDDRNAPVQTLTDDEEEDSDKDIDSDDEPMPEAAGQIKVALFRVLASGEVKRGEYSPQFDVHDDEEQMGNNNDGGEEIDHTTSFAKPKTLDPKTISTQTVTGIDPPDKPYAVFTFLYRGPKQLQKMGLMATSPKPEKTPLYSKRKSGGIDFGSLAPLSQGSQSRKLPGIREPSGSQNKSSSRNESSMDSDDEDEEDDDRRPKIKEEEDEKEISRTFLTAEEVLEESKLSDELRKTKLKRAHSAEPVNAHSPRDQASDLRPSPGASSSLTPTSLDTPLLSSTTNLNPNTTGTANGSATLPAISNPDSQPTSGLMGPPPTSVPDLTDASAIGSPFKKQRSSLPGIDSEVRRKLALDAAAGVTPRRESESGVTSATSSALANSVGGVGKETGFQPGPVLGSQEQVGGQGGEMEEEL